MKRQCVVLLSCLITAHCKFALPALASRFHPYERGEETTYIERPQVFIRKGGQLVIPSVDL